MKLKNFLATCCLFLTTTLAHAYLEIEITQGMDAAMPIAIVPFEGSRALPEEQDVSSIIQADLVRSGEFKPLDPENMAEQPVVATAVTHSYWRQLGIENVVVGQIIQEGAKYRVRFALVDAFNKSNRAARIGQEFVVDKAALRGLAHHISDLVYHELTGHRGAFSTRIAYVAMKWNRGKPSRYQLEIADADGFNPKAILSSAEPIMSPAWSPDGKKLAYVSFERHRGEIYLADVASGQRERVSAEPGINGAPAFSPDGSKLALVLSRQNVPKIFIKDLNTKQLMQVTQGPAIDTEPHWMPDGKSLLFTSTRGGQPQIYKVELGNKQITRITYAGEYNARPSVTADGRYMAMIHRVSGRYHIAVQDLKNNQVWGLTETRLDESPSFAPNGRMIIYGTANNDGRSLAAVSVDGRVKLRIPTNEGDVQEPAWSPYLSR